MASVLVNTWHLRKVADSAAKPCDVCYKPSASVLITPDNKDHFYICPGHLKDRGFCSPVIDEGAVAASAKKKKEEELEREIEAVKKEYEEKVKRRKKKGKGKGEDKGSKEKEKEDKEDEEAVEAARKEKDEKIKALTTAASTHQSSTTTTTTSDTDPIPRIYTLQKIFHQKRIDRIRAAELAKRNRERFRNPEALFPKVPRGDLDG